MDEAPKTTFTPPAGGPEVEQAKGTAWLSYLGIL